MQTKILEVTPRTTSTLPIIWTDNAAVLGQDPLIPPQLLQSEIPAVCKFTPHLLEGSDSDLPVSSLNMPPAP